MPTPLPMRFDDCELLWTVPGVYTPEECSSAIRRIDQAAPSLATNNPLYRDQDRVIEDDPQTASDLFERLRTSLPLTIGGFRLVGLNERLRYYRYRQGQKFAPHMDHWFIPSERRATLLTVLVYFNDDFDGGETKFMEQLEAVVQPAPGLVAVFQHKIRHEGAEILRGTKYAMRTDVVYETDDDIVRIVDPFNV